MGKKQTKRTGDEEGFLKRRNKQPPRMRVSGKISNNTVLHGTELCPTLSTGASSSVTKVVPLIGGSSTGLNANFTPLMNIAKNYNECLFQTAVMTYVPSVGLTTPGNVTIAFINNPETCFYLLEAARTDSEIAAIALGCSNSVTHAIWHEFTYAMNLPARRKRFDVNNTGPIGSIDTIERGCQGVFVIVISGAPQNTDVALPRRTCSILLEGLTSSIP